MPIKERLCISMCLHFLKYEKQKSFWPLASRSGISTNTFFQILIVHIRGFIAQTEELKNVFT